ncbi:MAG: hypothetical protein M3R63_09770 [Actinomycetota bacterium]|nr:hypothetical protein [Actinomycetota bacterium]
MGTPEGRWPRLGTPRRVAIEARTVGGGACTLLLLRDADGIRLLFHGAERTGANLSPRVYQDLIDALHRLAE